MKVCIIPARGGSKRISRKNIKPFLGQPIMAYSIQAAIESGCFDKVIVSTDDHEIAETAQRLGAEIPFLRPKNLADDYSGTIPVIKQAVEWYETHGFELDYVCCLYATAPFVQPQFLQEAFQQLVKSQADYCFSVTEFSSPIQRAFKVTNLNRLEMFNPECFHERSQDLIPAYHDAGQFYWGKPEAFKQQKVLFSEHSTPYCLPKYLVQDLDTLEDWKRAELMYQSWQKQR